MIQALQRLPKAEEEALIAVACANGLTRNELRCEMSRQRGSGSGQWGKGANGLLEGASFNIEYDLLLCTYCGNLNALDVCPHKANMIKERLLNA